MFNKNKIGLVLVLLVLSTLLFLVTINDNSVIKSSYKDFSTEDEFSNYTISNKTGKNSSNNPSIESFKEILLLNDIIVREPILNWKIILQLFFSLGIVFSIIYYSYKITKPKKPVKETMNSNFQPFQRSKNQTTFNDIAGNEEAKESVKDVIDFIRNPEKYKKYGARMPKGIIFYGPPGTGKTLMAKAIAGETSANFYFASGSDFVQMYVGVGASRIRELFKKASENEKSVIFIDEIDALAKKRGDGQVSGNDERDQTLNALLTEMSGFNSNDNILVIGATNRLDILDDAILRPGRFDRQIEISLPDINARKNIINYYFKNKPINKDVSINSIAKQTVYFSGAMLESFINEAAILAAKNNTGYITNNDFDKAFYTIIAGSEKLDKTNISQREREITAYHEAGHALLTKFLLPDHSVAKVTIIPSSKGAAGFSVNIPPDKMFFTKKELESEIVVLLGGRLAEEIIFGKENITTGGGNDIERGTGIAKSYIATYGMSESFGLINSSFFKDDSNLEKECISMINALYKRGKKILIDNTDILIAIADALLEKETIKEDELDLLISKKYTTLINYDENLKVIEKNSLLDEKLNPKTKENNMSLKKQYKITKETPENNKIACDVNL